MVGSLNFTNVFLGLHCRYLYIYGNLKKTSWIGHYLGHRKSSVRKRALITFSTWWYPKVNDIGELENALMNPVCNNEMSFRMIVISTTYLHFSKLIISKRLITISPNGIIIVNALQSTCSPISLWLVIWSIVNCWKWRQICYNY